MPVSAAARFRYIVAGGATAVVIGTGFLVSGFAHGGAGTAAPSSVDAPLAAASPDVTSEGDLRSGPSTPVSAPVSPRAPGKPSPSATSRSASPKGTVSKKVSTRKSPAASAAGRTAVPITPASVTERVLAHINEARVAEGLKALRLDAGLSQAAAVHNQLMIDGCGLSHRCPGEAGLGDRFSAQGVTWRTAGENIGYGSSGSSDAAMVGAANGLTDAMLAEVPPDDGHRKNLLNADFTRIGLSIVRDAKGITWMTQDFVG